MEHCVLCGSENYRLKDPFNILDKGSIHTYLNALTYQDKTLYPIGSTNEVDFETLMRVYLDAVFRTLIYENEGIFLQEGWHSDGEKINGVVLNEMKGAYSSPERVLETAINKELYKGTGYAFASGGMPGEIPKLSYAEFLEFHREKYHPSNAVIYLYGKLDIERYLGIIDKDFLADFEYKAPVYNTEFKLQKPNDVSVDFESKGKNMLMAEYNYVVKDSKDSLAVEILCDLICNSEGGALKEALLSAGLGSGVSGSFSDDGCLGCMGVCVEGSTETDVAKFKKVINKTISELKIDRHKAQGVINRLKFFFKEQDFGYKPKGLFYNVLLLHTVLYGKDDFEPLHINALFDGLEDYDWEGLAKAVFVDGCYGILNAVDKKTEPETAVPPKNNEPLLSYQASSDSEEEIAKIKTVPISKISRKAVYNSYEVNDYGLYVPVEDKGIVYTNVLFDTSALTLDELAYMNVYKNIVDLYDIELFEDIDYYTGGFDCVFSAIRIKKDFKPVISFNIKCLSENTEKAADILKRMFDMKFDDRARFERLVEEQREDIKQSYVTSGSVRAFYRALGGISKASAYTESVSGVEFYKRFRNMTTDELLEGIEKVKAKLFTKSAMFYSVTANSVDRAVAEKEVRGIYDALPVGELVPKCDIVLGRDNVGIISETQVNYNAAAFEMDCKSGVRKVVRQIISREYMWDRIRLEGGAYGGGAGFVSGKYCYLYSYRDPQLEKTYENFKGLGDYLINTDFSQKDINRFIIGAVNEEDTPEKNNSLGSIAIRYHFMGITEELLDKRRSEMLDTSPEDIKKFGQSLLDGSKNAVLVSVGTENAIKDNDIFKEFLHIH
jgi:hypothetical protein